MIASEAHPYAHTGGLAEVMAALSDALGGLGHRVTLILPRYRSVQAAGLSVQHASLTFGQRDVAVSFHTGSERGGVTPVFVDSPGLFDRDGLYGDEHGDYPDNAWRFAVFSRAALEYLRIRGTRPSVIHAHDWQTGLVPVYQKMLFSPDPIVGGVPVVFTIHNLAFQGVFPPATLPAVGLGWEVLDVQAMEYWGQISYLKGGHQLQRADHHRQPELCQRDSSARSWASASTASCGAAPPTCVGILNGDRHRALEPGSGRPIVPATFTADDLSGKHAAKRASARGRRAAGRRRGGAGRPVIGLISRLTDQKGFDLIAAALDELMSLDASWVLLGSGEPRYEELWRRWRRGIRDRVSATIGFDERLAHLIEAGSDMFLMPSRFEPCGLNQLYSLRYGTLPIVRATGGLKDTVRGCRPGRHGRPASPSPITRPAALVDAVRRALAALPQPGRWRGMQRARHAAGPFLGRFGPRVCQSVQSVDGDALERSGISRKRCADRQITDCRCRRTPRRTETAQWHPRRYRP